RGGSRTLRLVRSGPVSGRRQSTAARGPGRTPRLSRRRSRRRARWTPHGLSAASRQRRNANQRPSKSIARHTAFTSGTGAVGADCGAFRRSGLGCASCTLRIIEIGGLAMWRHGLPNTGPARALMAGSCLLLCPVLILNAGWQGSYPTGNGSAFATNRTALQPQPSLAPQADQDVEVAPNDLPPPPRHVHLPLPLERHTGDLGDMVKRRAIRALVVIKPMSFFYDGGRPRGVMCEALEELQKFINKKLNPGTIKVVITFVPVRLDQLEAALTEGVGDLIAYDVAITEERSRRVAFSKPLH